MAQLRWDAIIVGQGLAGTTLAWQLREAGWQVLLIDACEPVTSSKIAAGLITPITGKRLVLSQRYDERLTAAREFYGAVEKHTGGKFLHDRTAVRLFKSAEERENWARRSDLPDYRAQLLHNQPAPLLEPGLGDASGGGLAMHAAQLDVAAYLDASREVLDITSMALDWRRDVNFGDDGATVGEHRARYLISCEGYAATRNPYFSAVPFIAAKGDILTVRFHRPVPPNTLHRGIWVAPTAEADVFRVGSTYDWENLDQVPSATARSEIEGRLSEFFHVPYSVLDHRAAVRPIINESRALVGLHPDYRCLGYFNGLGSKGSLLAPWYARHLADHLVGGTPLPEELNVQQHF